MLFIKDQFAPRKTSGNIPDIQTPEYSPNDETRDSDVSETYRNNDDSQPVTQMDQETQNETVFARPPRHSGHSDKSNVQENPKRMKKDKEALDRLLQIEEQKLSCFQQSSQKREDLVEDDDYHFVISLIPYMKQLPTYRKMVVRTKFQQILADEHEALHSSRHVSESRPATVSPQYTPIATPSPLQNNSSDEISNAEIFVESIPYPQTTVCNNRNLPEGCQSAGTLFSTFLHSDNNTYTYIPISAGVNNKSGDTTSKPPQTQTDTQF